jgi:hypothetical protein
VACCGQDACCGGGGDCCFLNYVDKLSKLWHVVVRMLVVVGVVAAVVSLM